HAPYKPTWSYAELREHANRVANLLVEQLHVVPGNRVLLRGPNNQEMAAAWFGVLKAGAVAVTTMPLLRASELSAIHEIAELDAALAAE
ncbi:MAG TPA: AMP-binding protein, partial [Xanthobacteraceae bacterium]